MGSNNSISKTLSLRLSKNTDSLQLRSYPAAESSMGNMGSMSSSYVTPGSSNFMSQPGPWWTAFGSGGLEGEPPLLEGIAAV